MGKVLVNEYTISGGSWVRSTPAFSTWEVHPMSWAPLSLFVVKRDPSRQPTVASILLETSVLMENTVKRANGQLALHSVASRCSAPTGRFLSELLGLCVSLGSARYYGWSERSLIWDTDRLPAGHWLKSTSRSRPDFIVQVGPNLWRGIEARGRQRSRPRRVPTSDEAKKLVGLANWSSGVSFNPAWSMSWAWLTADGVEVDHFDPGDPFKLDDATEANISSRMGRAAAALLAESAGEIRQVEALARTVGVSSRLLRGGYADGRWLTVAVWAQPLRRGEQTYEPAADAVRESLGIESRSIGAFVGTAITAEPPETDDQIRALLS